MINQSIDDLLNQMSLLNNELVNTQRDLAKKNSQIERLNFQLNRSNAELRQFASIVSHNLRSPIAEIYSTSAMLKKSSSLEEKEKFQQFIFKAVENLNELIEDLGKILKTKSEINDTNEVIHFEKIIDNIKSSIRILIEKEKVQINTDFNATDKITSNKNYIHSIFYNLISNSIKYRQIDRQPVIDIISKDDNNNILIYFKDNGIGIDLDRNGDKVFGLYNRFNRDREGKGLGLYMVKTQVELLGGNIKIESALGVGTEFIIKLPQLIAPSSENNDAKGNQH